MKKIVGFVWEVAKIIIIASAIVIPIRYFLFQPFFVKGQSMDPNFGDGDYLIIDEMTYRFRNPQRGEVIVFNYPQDPSQRFIKRVIGLPGETIEIKDGRIYIYKDGKPEILDETDYLPQNLETTGNIKITIGENDFFVMGDNRNFSFDSRRFGLLPKGNIIGRVLLRAWPLETAEKIPLPAY
jgi:signal peptidase I